MRVRRIVPNIRSERLEESRAFYTGVFGLDAWTDLDWIYTFSSPASDAAQLSVIRGEGHPSASVHPDVTVEVEDVDAAYASAVDAGAEIVRPLADEPWGVRRFFLRDPNGVVLNVMSHRASSAR